ncbi:hypothetical protein [Arthrobacter sp. KK5.5]|uniref:hypothetical protein n=1 Tax=Arthrobacter sp. KK5.5 TaxID=3373084 RepID=UPI003EE4311B
MTTTPHVPGHTPEDPFIDQESVQPVHSDAPASGTSGPAGHTRQQTWASVPRPPRRAPATRPTRGDFSKDLGAIVVYGFGLAAMFFAGETFTRPVHEELLVLILASITVAAVVVSAVLRSLGFVASFVAVLVRWIPAALLLLGSFSFLIGLFLDLSGNEANPGLGNGFVLMIVLAILAGAPRSTEDTIRTRIIWGWFAAGLLTVLTIVNLIFAFQATNPESSVPAVLVVAAAAAALLWLPVPAGRSVAAFAGIGLLAALLLVPGSPDATRIGGEFSSWLSFPTMLMLIGLLALGFPRARADARLFADGTAWVVALAAAAVLVVNAPALAVLSWTGPQLLAILSGVAAVVHLAVRRSDRRARVLPALATSAALLVLTTVSLVFQSFGSAFGPFMHLVIVLAVLALVAVSRLDRDPGFRILTPALTAYHGENHAAAAAVEASAYRQSAGVLAGLSLLTGPLGILFGQLALGRANRAETSGLHTTAIRMVAGTGIAVGVATTVWLLLFLIMAA